jgi:hypothetical protein
LVPGRRVGSQKDSLITMMMSGFSAGMAARHGPGRGAILAITSSE